MTLLRQLNPTEQARPGAVVKKLGGSREALGETATLEGRNQAGEAVPTNAFGDALEHSTEPSLGLGLQTGRAS